MAFKKKTWVNVSDPSKLPDIPEGQDSLARFDADNMNRIEEGIEGAYSAHSNVPNVSTNDQTPTYTESSSLVNLTSGEKISITFGKIKKAITELISHISNKTNPHKVTPSQIGAIANTIHLTEPQDVLAIETTGLYYCYNATNVPPESNKGYVRVYVCNTKYRVVYWRPAYSHAEYVNVRSDGSWIGWVETFTSNGGRIKGALKLGKFENGYTLFNKDHSEKNDYGLLITDSSVDGKTVRLSVCGETNNIAFYDNSNAFHNIFGQHNKRAGSYNGSTPAQSDFSPRTVDTKGVGNVLMMIDQVGNQYICTSWGSVKFSGAGKNVYSTSTFKNGILSINDRDLDFGGYTYNWYVL